MTWRVFAIIVLTGAAPAQAKCIPIKTFWSPDLFARYPAQIAVGPWRAPDLKVGAAHCFRSMLRTYGQGEPDFAGRWKVVPIGCGAGAMCPAFVDRVSGHVRFVPALRVIAVMPRDLGRSTPVTYRRSSRLLVVVGARNERADATGVTLYDWRRDGPRSIRFVPERELCVEDEPA